jgi:hypothetical protein
LKAFASPPQRAVAATTISGGDERARPWVLTLDHDAAADLAQLGHDLDMRQPVARASSSRFTRCANRKRSLRRALIALDRLSREVRASVHEPADNATLAAVERLPAGQRRAVILHYFLDWSCPKVAELLKPNRLRPGQADWLGSSP